MMLDARKASHRRSLLRNGWVRLLGLLLFVYAINYAPVHLALEIHVADIPAAGSSNETWTATLLTAEEAEHSDHAPHLASDHSLRLVSHTQVVPVVLDTCVTTSTVEVWRSHFLLPLFLTERQHPPGLPPPDPLQPRAPPLV